MARTASWAGLCLLLFGTVAFAGNPEASAAVAQLSTADELPLAGDDECAAGDDACALSAVQMRARSNSNSETESDESLEDLGNLSDNSTGRVMTLYHQTNNHLGRMIVKSSFKLGHVGWCGAGIYFATSPAATTKKAIGPESHHGFIIEAKVNVGRAKSMPWHCTTSIRCHKPYHLCQDRHNEGYMMRRMGYDSIMFNPGDGQEVVIWDSRRVLSMRQYHR